MEIPIIIALISATVTSIGWLINHILTARRDRKVRQITTVLTFTERQLEELYGPLAFLVWEGQRAFTDLLEIFGRNYVFSPSGKLPESELKIWLFWLDNYFFPKNEKIRELLMSKTHLIEGNEMPSSHLTFLEHHNSWYLNHKKWKEDGIDYSWHSKINAPSEFADDIISTFKQLKTRHSKALHEVSTIIEPR